MDVRQIASLLAIADHGSFSAAARAMVTVQSNVSAHIARLERDVGATLVDRASGSLTEEGLLVAEHGRRIMREIDDIAADIAALHDIVAGEARLGVIGTTGRWLMPQFLSRLAQAHPAVRPLISEGGTSSLIPRLLSGHLDAAIVHLPVEEPELQVEPLFAEDLVLLVHARHPWHGQKRLSMANLADHPLLLPPPSATLRRIINRAADDRHVTLRVQAEIDGVRLMASLAFEGFGAAIVPATAVPVWLTGNFSTIAVPDLPRRVVGWVQRRRPGPSAVTRACLDIARAVIQRREGRQPGLYVGPEALAEH
ncbi:MAG: LysR family transcriptional regulator [Ilumatobacteraceae bacterium]